MCNACNHGLEHGFALVFHKWVNPASCNQDLENWAGSTQKSRVLMVLAQDCSTWRYLSVTLALDSGLCRMRIWHICRRFFTTISWTSSGDVKFHLQESDLDSKRFVAQSYTSKTEDESWMTEQWFRSTNCCRACCCYCCSMRETVKIPVNNYKWWFNDRLIRMLDDGLMMVDGLIMTNDG